MALELKTPPSGEPLSLAEAQAYLKTTDPAEDAWITSAIQAVRQQCEAFTRRALMTQTWALWRDAFPSPSINGLNEIELPFPPLASVTHLRAWDAAGTGAVFDSGNYLVDTASTPGRIVLRETAVWPSNLRNARAVEVEYVAGYGNTAADVPEALKQGMLLWMRLLYADKTWLFDAGAPVPGLPGFNREDLPLPVRALWDPYRLPRLA